MRVSLVFALGGCALFTSCATTYGPYDTSYMYLYGQRVVEYGDGRHPGAIFSVPRGTPVVAASDGEVTSVRPSTFGGFYVGVVHSTHFTSWYGHLEAVHARQGQVVKRGDFLGFTGADNRGRQYLHYRICQRGVFCNDFEYSLDPAKFWLGGKLQCFDRGGDYSRASQTEMTVPLACGDHARALIATAKGAD